MFAGNSAGGIFTCVFGAGVTSGVGSLYRCGAGTGSVVPGRSRPFPHSGNTTSPYTPARPAEVGKSLFIGCSCTRYFNTLLKKKKKNGTTQPPVRRTRSAEKTRLFEWCARSLAQAPKRPAAPEALWAPALGRPNPGIKATGPIWTGALQTRSAGGNPHPHPPPTTA